MITYTCVVCQALTIEAGRLAALLHEVAGCACCYLCGLRLASEMRGNGQLMVMDFGPLEEEKD